MSTPDSESYSPGPCVVAASGRGSYGDRMRIALCFVVLVLSVLPSSAMYMRPELEDVPLDRLIENLTTRVEAEPKDLSLIHI